MKNVMVKAKQVYDTEQAARLVQTASQFKSSVFLYCGNKTANAKSIMGLLSLGLADGSAVEIKAEGEDANLAYDAIGNFLTNYATAPQQ